MSRKKKAGTKDDSTTSKWILAKRIADAEVLAAFVKVKAGNVGGTLWMIYGNEAYEAVMLKDLAAALPHLDEQALSIKCSLMLVQGTVVGCACGTYGQCCRIAKKENPRPARPSEGSSEAG